MTPLKELFITARDRLKNLPDLEYIDLYRGQFENSENSYPNLFRAALIRINGIDYTPMTQGIQEGVAALDILIYSFDRFADQHQDTSDPQEGLADIDLIDTITGELVGLSGQTFRPLSLTQQGIEETDFTLAYKVSFTAPVYFKLKQGYTPQRLQAAVITKF